MKQNSKGIVKKKRIQSRMRITMIEESSGFLPILSKFPAEGSRYRFILWQVIVKIVKISKIIDKTKASIIE